MSFWRKRGRVLAVKWGYNPNSSSLGVDVTFLLFGLAAITLLTPIISFLIRSRRQRAVNILKPPPADDSRSLPTSPES